MSRLPPLAAVRVFEAAARHENFSRAAEELAMTQAGVSYQIKLLEERLGAQLFVRRGRNMVLTALGRRIAPRVSESFAGLEEAFALVRAENERVLTITAPSSFATLWLSARLGAFQLRHPELAVRLDVSNRLVDLESGEFDVAIRRVVRPGPELEAHFVMRHVFTPMASPDFLLHHPVNEPRDFLSLPRISAEDEWWPRWLEQLPEPPPSLAAPAGLRFESQALDSQAALAGHGVAMLSPFLFARELEQGRLIAPFPYIGREIHALWLCYSPVKRGLAKVRAFRQWLLAEARSSAGSDPWGVLDQTGLAD